MIEKHHLANGVRVIAEHLPHVRSVSLGLWVGAGSRHETKDKNGISHFIEHMMFKGTEERTARQIAEAFDEIGGMFNAFTSKEMTCYYAKVLDQHFGKAASILSDMYLHSVFSEEEIEKEKKVVLEEIYMVEDTPDDLVHDLLSTAVMGSHPLGMPILGTEETVRSFTRSELMTYRSERYDGENLVIAVAGHLPTDYLQIIEKFFAVEYPSVDHGPDVTVTYEAGVQVRKKETEQAHMAFGLPGVSIRDSRIYASILFSNLLGGNMSSRLFQEIREERGLAYSVFSHHSAYLDGGLFTIYAGTRPGQEDEVLDVVWHILEDIRRRGVNQSELDKTREQLKGSMILGLESSGNRMQRLGKNELLLGSHLSIDEIIEKVDAVTEQDIHSLAKSLLSQPMAMAIVSPNGKVPSSYRRDLFV
ncbi:pitrilysin family protein [Mechercharimyces sp. CAU 1602]|uniref:M16 family metallopeptidase n=1 Tax=Mechercharimyces sp. CAU 1602 TaxID=2973933 RepID=UPI002162834A|nr:pitrilysin family protein [Mechercharimyces sp. CAU 1602]MCS1351264.1 insulinase family protein [Mechercharimyces sp. CAU 1602]